MREERLFFYVTDLYYYSPFVVYDSQAVKKEEHTHNNQMGGVLLMGFLFGGGKLLNITKSIYNVKELNRQFEVN